MAQTTKDQRAMYPLPAYNYRVDVAGAGMSFSEVSGIVTERGHVTYRHGLSFLEGEMIEQYEYEKFVPVTLKRGTVIGVEHLHEWLAEGDLRNIDVSLCDESGSPVVTWHIAKAVPVKLQAPTLSADSNEVAVESLEVMATNVSVEHHTGTGG